MTAPQEGVRALDVSLLKHYRKLVGIALSAFVGVEGSALSDMHTDRAPGNQKLTKPRYSYIVTDADGKVSHRVKPEWSTWTMQVHATAQRPPKYGRPLITESQFMWSRYARCVYELPPTLITHICARSHPTPMIRMWAQQEASKIAAAEFSTERVKGRAYWLARAYFAYNGGDIGRIHALIGLDKDDWQRSPIRRTYVEVRRVLATSEAEALEAWADACQQKNLPL